MSEQLDNAASAALFMLGLTQDRKREHMGALFSKGDGYGRSNIVTTGDRGQVSGVLSVPAGSLAALFHNHPSEARTRDPAAEQFSPGDVSQARSLGKASYISTPSGATLKYDPATGQTSEVLAEFPIAEFKTFLMQRLLGRAADDPRGLYK